MAPSEIDMAERVVRLETKIDFIIDRMDHLPPSPTCLAKHKELEDRLDMMETWRNRMIGAFLVLNIILVALMDKIKAAIFH
jgi:hypothetical protein